MGNKKEIRDGPGGMKIDGFKKKNEKIKVLLLSTGETGKTTLFNQIKYYVSQTYYKEKGEFSKEELNLYKRIIYSNILLGLRNISNICSIKKIKIKEESNVNNKLIHRIILKN
jgi:hypothetical protein